MKVFLWLKMTKKIVIITFLLTTKNRTLKKICRNQKNVSEKNDCFLKRKSFAFENSGFFFFCR